MTVNFSGYHIAISGMRVNQFGLNVTGHNISNINTPGYVRQQAMLSSNHNLTEFTKYGINQYGLGADIQQVRQIRHEFLDTMYRQENNALGYWQTKSKTFSDVQIVLGEPIEYGLQEIMNQFWDSWQELSKNAESFAVRALVRQRAENLVHQINYLGHQIDRLQADLNTELRVTIGEANDIMKDIANLNQEIAQIELSGGSANDLRDARNLHIDRLTMLMDCQVQEMEDGQVNIQVGGHVLVTKGICREIVAAPKEKGDVFHVPKIKGLDIELPVKSGVIKGLMEARGEVSGTVGDIESGAPDEGNVTGFVEKSSNILSDLKKKLNAFVNILLNEINELHKSGKTMDRPPENGQDFFVAINPGLPLQMGNIKLNDNLVDLNKIVASAGDDVGDNTIAVQIANLRHEQALRDQSGTLNFEDYYRLIVLDVANDAAEAQKIASNQKSLVEAIDSQRHSIMGTSMDEEMTNMMKFKFAYNASSRSFSIIDQMIDTIVNRMGIVGR